MRSFKVEGIIIKRRNFGEADKMLTVFTKTMGKIQVKAVGVRRIPSRRSAHVELLNHCILHLYKGRNYPVLTEAQSIESFSNLKEDLQMIGKAYHICEVIDGLCPENQENTRVFYLLKNIFTALSGRNNPLKESGYSYENISWPMQINDSPIGNTNIRKFEIDLLDLLGYLPTGKQDWNVMEKNFDSRYFIENILERKLKSNDIFSKLAADENIF